MKKSPITQELANLFPPWTKVSQSELSLGFQILNAIAQPMEKMEKSLRRMGDNYFLSTVNLDEIDLTYKVDLSTDFEFDTNTSDMSRTVYLPPTVSGYLDGEWLPVSLADENTVENFWYHTYPNRVSLETIVTGVNHILYETLASGTPVDVDLDHHLDGGYLYLECVSGIQYISLEDGDIKRGKISLSGITRKGTQEEETLIFPWNMKQRTKKEWSRIHRIAAYDMEDNVSISLTSADFNSGPYQDFWNLEFSKNRNKIDVFWNLGTVGDIQTLDKITYTSDEWQQLIMGLATKEVVWSTELLDESLNPVTGVDLAIQPFTDNCWIVTASGMLYCYDLHEYIPYDSDLLAEKTIGADVQIELEKSSVVYDEEIIFMPWHIRAIKEILKYRVWYQTPNGTQYGLLNGVQVPITSNFWVKGSETLVRSIDKLCSITADELGDYLIVVETIFIDNEEQNDRVIVSVQHKIPETSLDLSSIIPEEILGITFDSDQKLWIRTTNKYYQINLHSDVMVIDYENKTIYTKERYNSLEVITND